MDLYGVHPFQLYDSCQYQYGSSSLSLSALSLFCWVIRTLFKASHSTGAFHYTQSTPIRLNSIFAVSKSWKLNIKIKMNVSLSFKGKSKNMLSFIFKSACLLFKMEKKWKCFPNTFYFFIFLFKFKYIQKNHSAPDFFSFWSQSTSVQ